MLASLHRRDGRRPQATTQNHVEFPPARTSKSMRISGSPFEDVVVDVERNEAMSSASSMDWRSIAVNASIVNDR